MTFEQILVYFLGPLAAYFLGAVPFAFVIGKARGVDIRKTGSGNIGATNLGRTLGKKYFWYAFALDAAKGFIPVLLMSLLVRHWNAAAMTQFPSVTWVPTPLGQGQPNMPTLDWRVLPAWSPLLTAAACMLGHVFPIYLKFKGGKGVATGFGVVLGFWPLFTLAGLGGGLVFVIVLGIYRYISLASITGALAFAILVAVLGSSHNSYLDTYQAWPDLSPLLIAAGLFSGLIIFRHRSNIVRLLKGTEPQVGQREIEKAQMPAPPKDKN